jgi:hypothetical protein
MWHDVSRRSQGCNWEAITFSLAMSSQVWICDKYGLEDELHVQSKQGLLLQMNYFD